MFGLMGTVLGWLGYQVGQRTDEASASGSVHAKLGDIKGYMTGTQNTNLNNILAAVNRAPYAAGKTVTITYGYAYDLVSAVGLTNIMTITGPRVILGGYVEIKCGTDTDLDYTFTLDGYTLLNSFDQNSLRDNVPGEWDTNSTSNKNTLAYRNPMNFAGLYTGSTTAYHAPGGPYEWFVIFPPLTPINSILRLAYDATGSAQLGCGWGIWHTAP